MYGKTNCNETKISSKLVHIEQLIGSGKAFRIITLALIRTETKLASDKFCRCVISINALFHHLN
jgi:hypothetical protein